jgi:hypothetical protein
MKNPVAVPPESDPKVSTRPSGVRAACTATSGQLSSSGESQAPFVRSASAESDAMNELSGRIRGRRRNSALRARSGEGSDREALLPPFRRTPTPRSPSAGFFLLPSTP